MRKKREDVITVRITKEEHQILQLMAKKSQYKQSELIRQAVIMYINVFEQIPELSGGHIIFHHDMLKVLLDSASDETIHALANTTFRIGMREDQIDITLKPAVKNQADPTNLEHYLKTLATLVLSNSGQRWFEHVSYTRTKRGFTFGGQHSLGRNFSQFIYYLMQNYSGHYFYKVDDPILEDHRIILQINPQNLKSISSDK